MTSNGYKLIFQAPGEPNDSGSDLALAYDKAAGKDGATWEDACANTGYRGTLPEWAVNFVPKLVALTGVHREIDAEATEKAKKRAKDPTNVKNVMEKFKAYNNRVRETWANGDEGKLAQMQTLAQETADETPLDPAPSARVSAVDKAYIAKAEDILSHDEDYIEARVAKMLAMVPGFNLNRDEDDRPEKTSFGRLIAKWIEAKLEE